MIFCYVLLWNWPCYFNSLLKSFFVWHWQSSYKAIAHLTVKEDINSYSRCVMAVRNEKFFCMVLNKQSGRSVIQSFNPWPCSQGPFLCGEAVCTEMLRARRGCQVHQSPSGGQRGGRDGVQYSTEPAALSPHPFVWSLPDTQSPDHHPRAVSRDAHPIWQDGDGLWCC